MSLRLATWNVQWFDHLFDDRSEVRADDGPAGRHGVPAREQAEAVAQVLRALDADAVMVIEAPDSRRRTRKGLPALAAFARRFDLRTSWAVLGFPSDTQQEITLLLDPDRVEARHDPRADAVPRFDGAWHVPLNNRSEPIRWSKPPLEVALTTPSGAPLRLIGVHAKSKNPHGARVAEAALRISIENRRKQLAQCLWLRARVEKHLAARDPLVVLGDFNDGPGLDEHEREFGRSGVEIVLGEGEGARLHDPHAQVALSRPNAAAPVSARFRVPTSDGSGFRWLSALLDYAMVSPDLLAGNPRWRIWHPFDDPACWSDESLRRALLHASDHFPVTLDLDL